MKPPFPGRTSPGQSERTAQPTNPVPSSVPRRDAVFNAAVALTRFALNNGGLAGYHALVRPAATPVTIRASDELILWWFHVSPLRESLPTV